MKKISKITAVLLALVMILSLAACGSDDKEEFDYTGQIELLASNMEFWYMGLDDDFYEYSYAVADMDQNGRLEIIAATEQGSGQFTTMNMYEVNEAKDGIEWIGFEDEDMRYSAPDILYSSFYCYEVDGTYHYVVDDLNRNGIWDNVIARYDLSKVDTSLTAENICYADIVYTVAEDEQMQDGQYICYLADSDDNFVTKAEYDELVDQYFEDADNQYVANFNFIWSEEISELSTEELEELLQESLDGWSLDSDLAKYEDGDCYLSLLDTFSDYVLAEDAEIQGLDPDNGGDIDSSETPVASDMKNTVWDVVTGEIEGDLWDASEEGVTCTVIVNDGTFDFYYDNNSGKQYNLKGVSYEIVDHELYWGCENSDWYADSVYDSENEFSFTMIDESMMIMQWYQGSWDDEVYPAVLTLNFIMR